MYVIHELYNNANTQEDIKTYSTQLISLGKEIKTVNGQLRLYTVSAAGVWGLNVIHALVLDPTFNAYDLKTTGSAFARSLLLPGFGQLYSGRKIAGYSFIGAELALIGLTINSLITSRSLQSDQEKTQTSYTAATDQEEIDAYSAELVDLDKKIKTANNLSTILIISAVGVWVLNVIDAAIKGPKSNADVSTVPITLAYDPIMRQTRFQWTVYF